MHLFFVDESGTPAKLAADKPRHFVIGGVVISDTAWHTVREKLLGLKIEKQYRGEVKWRFFAPNNKDDDNPMRDWSFDERNEFRDRVFRIINENKSIKVLCCVTDCKEAYKIASINTQADLYFRTYKPLTERFQYMLQDVSREVGVKISGLIVADHRGSKDDNKMRQQHERLVHETGQNTSSYTNLVEGLFFAPSHMSVGIQLADMVAGAVWRKFERDDSTYFDVIQQSFRSSKDGTINGYGLVKFPRNWD
jgi:hypothetical protein